MGNTIPATSPQSTFCYGKFSTPARAAIHEEKQLRSEGASFWDTFRRISFIGALARLILATLTLGLFECKARSWQAAADRTAARPRELRIRETKNGGLTVCGGTLERNELRNRIKAEFWSDVLELTHGRKTQLPTNSPIDNVYIRSFCKKEKRPELTRDLGIVCAIARDHLDRFRNTHFENLTKQFPPSTATMEIDAENDEVVIEISQQSRHRRVSENDGSENDKLLDDIVTTTVVVRVPCTEPANLRVISIDATKRLGSLDPIPEERSDEISGSDASFEVIHHKSAHSDSEIKEPDSPESEKKLSGEMPPELRPGE